MNDQLSAFEEASALLDEARFADARNVLSDVISHETDNHRAHAFALRGWSWFRESDFRRALADFDNAISINPNAVNTLYLRARCHEELNNPADALADYESVVCLNSNTPDAWEGASLLHRYFGREQEADDCARKAVASRALAR